MTDTTYSLSIDNVDWVELKAALKADDFDNGRTPAQLKRSAENSAINCFAYAGGKVIGTVRALSDTVCNAYIVDVWTQSQFRKQGIARTMMEMVAEQLPGQHIYLFTDDAMDFYRKIGFAEQGVGMSKLSGHWLENDSRNAQLE